MLNTALFDQPLGDRPADQAAGNQSDPSPDLRGSAEYKRDLTRVMTKRAIGKAIDRAKGGAS